MKYEYKNHLFLLSLLHFVVSYQFIYILRNAVGFKKERPRPDKLKIHHSLKTWVVATTLKPSSPLITLGRSRISIYIVINGHTIQCYNNKLLANNTVDDIKIYDQKHQIINIDNWFDTKCTFMLTNCNNNVV